MVTIMCTYMYSCADDYTLMISNVQLDDDAIFECQVGADDNSPGLRSAKAEITVQGQYVNLSRSYKSETENATKILLTSNACV